MFKDNRYMMNDINIFYENGEMIYDSEFDSDSKYNYNNIEIHNDLIMSKYCIEPSDVNFINYYYDRESDNFICCLGYNAGLENYVAFFHYLKKDIKCYEL